MQSILGPEDGAAPFPLYNTDEHVTKSALLKRGHFTGSMSKK
jgi:hypothetical protein